MDMGFNNFLLIYQEGFIIFVLIRRNIIDAKGDYSSLDTEKYEFENRKVKAWKN